MKCDIIRDLLPLYMEGLCSAETNDAVDVHLAQCQECRQEYLQLQEEYRTVDTGAEDLVGEFLKEKDLLEKSKQEMKESVVDKIFHKILLVIFVSGLVINIAMCTITLIAYQYKYPHLYFDKLGVTQIWILVLPFLPTILALIGRNRKIKQHKILFRGILVGLIPAIFFGGFCTVAFLIIPPICSETNNPVHYLEMDNGLDTAKHAISTFYPEQIPANAEHVTYHYEKYSALFSDRFNLEASWILPSDEYKAEKQRILESRQFQGCDISGDAENGVILNTLYPDKITVIFEYHDKTNKISYRAYMDKDH